MWLRRVRFASRCYVGPWTGSASHNVQAISAVLKLSARMRSRLFPDLLNLRCLAVSSQLQSLITSLSPSQLHEPVFSSTPVPAMSSGEQIENTMGRDGDVCDHTSPATRRWLYGRQNAFAEFDADDARETVMPSITQMDAVGPVISGDPVFSQSDSRTIPDSDGATSFSADDEKIERHKSQTWVWRKTDRMEEIQRAQMQDHNATSTVKILDIIRRALGEIKQNLELTQDAVASLETEMHRRAPANVAEFSQPSSGPEPAAIVADETSKAEQVLYTNDQKRRRSSSGHVVEMIPDSQGAAKLHEEDQQGRDRPAKRQRCQ